MRISKEPEERKQEILETAIKLFSVNGFEKTSISDIAKEIGIAQGLCYRYFPSKDVLFQSAINEYSNILVANMTKNINIKNSRTNFVFSCLTTYGCCFDSIKIQIKQCF